MPIIIDNFYAELTHQFWPHRTGTGWLRGDVHAYNLKAKLLESKPELGGLAMMKTNPSMMLPEDKADRMTRGPRINGIVEGQLVKRTRISFYPVVLQNVPQIMDYP